MRKTDPKPNQMITDFKEMMERYNERGITSLAVEDELILDTVNSTQVLMNEVQIYLARLVNNLILRFLNQIENQVEDL